MDIIDTVIPNELILFFTNIFQLFTIFMICIWVSWYFIVFMLIYFLLIWKLLIPSLEKGTYFIFHEKKLQEKMFILLYDAMEWKEYYQFHLYQMMKTIITEKSIHDERILLIQEEKHDKINFFSKELTNYYQITLQSFRYQRILITRLDSISSGIIFFLTILVIFMKGMISPIAFGIMITYGSQLNVLCQRTLQLFLSLTESFISVEKMLEINRMD